MLTMLGCHEVLYSPETLGRKFKKDKRRLAKRLRCKVDTEEVKREKDEWGNELILIRFSFSSSK